MGSMVIEYILAGLSVGAAYHIIVWCLTRVAVWLGRAFTGEKM